MKYKQTSLFKKTSLSFGGDLYKKGMRKKKRPLDTTKPIHLIFRSRKAIGKYNLLNYRKEIENVVNKYSKCFRVSIYRFANVGNHVHLLIRGKSRIEIQSFMRILPGIIARIVTKAKKGSPFGKFWDKIAYTRVLSSWRKDFTGVFKYVEKNIIQALGVDGLLKPLFRNPLYRNLT